MPAQSSVRALRLTLAVPASVETGQNVTLACDHDPEGDELYAVKWYRQRTLGETRGREFVRYTPKEIPAVKFFPLHGVTVDVSGAKRMQSVVLDGTNAWGLIALSIIRAENPDERHARRAAERDAQGDRQVHV